MGTYAISAELDVKYGSLASRVHIQVAGKREQTKFDDLRRGLTEEIQRLTKLKRMFPKITKKVPSILGDLRF